MTIHEKDQAAIKQYLLGDTTAEVQQGFEQSLMTDGELFDQLLAAEDELIDEYIAGMVDKEQAEMFEKHFLVTDERQQKLRFAGAFRKYAASQAIENASSLPKHSATSSASIISRPPASRGWQQFFAPSPWKVAAFAVVVLIAGVGIWRLLFYQSDVDKGLVALNAAYKQQRPIEARISKLGYAPFVTTRGGESERVDSLARNRAEAILSNAVIENHSAAANHALGEVYLAKKQFDDAIKEFEEALKTDPKNPQLLSDLGAAWLEKGRIDLDKGKAAPTSLDSGKGLEELGRSLENLNTALELNQNLLEALFNRALCEQHMTLYAKAEDDWRQYLQKDSSSQWAEEARRSLKALEDRKNKAAQSEKQLQQDFLDAFNNKDDEKAWAALSRSRARTGNLVVEALLDDYLKLAASDGVAEANDKLRMLAYAGTIEEQRAGDRFTLDVARLYSSATPAQRATLAQARELMKSATEYYNTAEWKQAIEVFLKARELFAQTGDEGERLFAEAWIGYCYLRMPDPERGAQTFQHLSEVFETRNYKSLFAQSLLALADTLNSQNEFSKVLEQANRAFGVSEQIQDHANAVRCLQAGTSMQLILGNYRESLAATFRALTLADALPPDPKLRWPFYHEASLDFYFLGMPESALQFENEALRLATSAGLSLLASRSYDRRALILERLRNYDEAMKNSEQARVEGQKIQDERARTNILAHSALNLGKLYRESGDLQRAVDCYDQALELYKKLDLDTYQYEAHKGKLLALIGLNNNARAEAELSTVLFWFEQNREKIAEESYRDKFFDTDQNTYEVAVDFEYGRKNDASKAFDYAEAYRARSLLDLISTGAQINGDIDRPEIRLSSTVSPLTLIQIQQRLPKQTQLLEYTVLDDKILMWVITRDGLKSAQSNISRNELEQKIRSYLRALSGGHTNNNDEVISRAKELYTTLVGPTESYLNSSLQLCIVPDDNLNFLPFAALVSPASGRYLVEDFTLETSPSATTFITGSEQAKLREQNRPERLLIVGNPHFDREQFVDLPDLPGSEREAEKIADLYTATPLVGNEAVAGRVKQLLKDADVVHFATHALPDERSPLLSKLLLSRDGTRDAHHASPGFLQASEIYGMKLPRTRLAVLSACQTGIERAYRGEGAIGLARPFIAAGVPLVVASLWAVESETTADLMISFHKHRKQDHVSTVEALRRAQLEIIHNQQPTSQKNYGWAAFVAIGGYANF